MIRIDYMDHFLSTATDVEITCDHCFRNLSFVTNTPTPDAADLLAQVRLVSRLSRRDAHRFYLRKGMSIEAHYFSMDLK